MKIVSTKLHPNKLCIIMTYKSEIANLCMISKYINEIHFYCVMLTFFEKFVYINIMESLNYQR